MALTRRQFIVRSAMAGASLGAMPLSRSEAATDPIRIGVIGLDTSHSPAFAKLFNAENPEPGLSGFRVVAACPQGSADIKGGMDRLPEFTKEIQQYGVEIVTSINAVLQKSDVVLLETNDGRPHLEQAREVIKAGKPFFIDKPVAASLRDVVTIYREAAAKNVPLFSASALRYMKNVQAVRVENKIGSVLGADAFSPATIEPHHPDLFWYGIHGVEILYTLMGAGCETVTRFQNGETEIAVGNWKDRRLGTFRGTRNGKHDYGGTAFGSNGNLTMGSFEGYQALVQKIAEFFRTKNSPVDPKETIEIYAFMEAADESKRRGGIGVSIDEVMRGAGGK